MKYKKISNNENAIEIDGKVILSFDPRYKKYLKWRDKNPELEEKLIDNIEQEIENKRLYNLGAPHKEYGTWKWYNEDGQLILESIISPDEEEIQEVDGLFEGTHGEVPISGLFIEYYESGKKKSEKILRNGKEDGLCTIWYENGQKQKKETYKNGKRDGKWDSWSIEGLIQEQKNYNEGTIDGEYIIWYSSGDKKLHITYKDGKRVGKWIEWYVGGQKRSEGNMLYGMMDGKWIFWYHNGKKELEFNLDFGNPVGSAKIYHDNGILKERVSF